jgi:uncharacterized protein YjbK
MTNGIVAGNTADTLAATPVQEAAQGKTPYQAETVLRTTYLPEDQTNTDDQDDLDVEFEPESAFVTREEFDALLERIERFNVRAPHKL